MIVHFDTSKQYQMETKQETEQEKKGRFVR